MSIVRNGMVKRIKPILVEFELDPQIINIVLMLLIVGVAAFNQLTIQTITPALALEGDSKLSASVAGAKDISSVDISTLKSTGHSVAALFDVESIQSAQDAIDVMIPTGTPSYGQALGISYDDPINSLNFMARQLYSQAQNSVSAETKQRFINLASKPVGISCEYCCGIGPVGIRPDGTSGCGCQHNPALIGLGMWLMENTDMTDQEVLKELLVWKSLFFPKNMVGMALQVAGGDTSSLADVPGMVGGC
jgi:hypothetical protein